MGDATTAKPVNFTDLDLTHDSQSFIPLPSTQTPPTIPTPPDDSLPSPPAPLCSQFGFLCKPEKPKSDHDTWLITQLQITSTSAIVSEPVQPSITVVGVAQECNATGDAIAASRGAEPDVDFEEEWAIQQWERWQGDADTSSPLHGGITIDAVMARLEEASLDQSYDVCMDIDTISELMETSL